MQIMLFLAPISSNGLFVHSHMGQPCTVSCGFRQRAQLASSHFVASERDSDSARNVNTSLLAAGITAS
jgi:hypothetical protein